MKIGCDLQSIGDLRTKPDLMGNQAILTNAERTYCDSKEDPWPTLAGVLSAKEACFKALSGIDGLPRYGFREVEIIHAVSGRPAVNTAGELRRFLEHRGLHIEISISHSGDYAMATAIVF